MLDTDLVSQAHLASRRRIVVMRPPGSGKSTLARHLGKQNGLPVFHLDQAFWQPGWARTPADRFRSEVERIVGLPAWVIDGNYTDTVTSRFAAADLVIYLDVPSWRCMLRLLRRTLMGYGRVRADAAPGCAERLDMAFLRFAWSWNRTRRVRTLALVGDFFGAKLVLRTEAGRQRLLGRRP